ncbi:MAG: hypothetical protein NUV67_04980, partial [archaeon]|nr:hypothetical protein [archaeon]
MDCDISSKNWQFWIILLVLAFAAGYFISGFLIDELAYENSDFANPGISCCQSCINSDIVSPMAIAAEAIPCTQYVEDKSCLDYFNDNKMT